MGCLLWGFGRQLTGTALYFLFGTALAWLFRTWLNYSMLLKPWWRSALAQYFRFINKVRCPHNAVNFLQNHYNRHPKARPTGELSGVCCDSNDSFTFCHCYRRVLFKYRDKLGDVITALDSTFVIFTNFLILWFDISFSVFRYYIEWQIQPPIIWKT